MTGDDQHLQGTFAATGVATPKKLKMSRVSSGSSHTPARLYRQTNSTADLVLSGPQAQIAQRARSSAGQSDVLAPHHVDKGGDSAGLHEGSVVLRLEREGLQGPRRGRLLLRRACRWQHKPCLPHPLQQDCGLVSALEASKDRAGTSALL